MRLRSIGRSRTRPRSTLRRMIRRWISCSRRQRHARRARSDEWLHNNRSRICCRHWTNLRSSYHYRVHVGNHANRNARPGNRNALRHAHSRNALHRPAPAINSVAEMRHLNARRHRLGQNVRLRRSVRITRHPIRRAPRHQPRAYPRQSRSVRAMCRR